MVSLKIFGTILMQLFAVLFWEHHFSHNKVHGNNSEQILVLQFVHRIFKICTFSLKLFRPVIIFHNVTQQSQSAPNEGVW